MGWRGILGFEYGIVQAPLGPDISGPELVAAVANAGGLAFLRSPDWESPDYLRELISKTRSLTDKPFGVAVVLAFPHEKNINVILEEKVAVLQVYWGDCSVELVMKAHRSGVKIVPQVGSLEEAKKAISAGIDAIIVQGCEAGGHVISQVYIYRSVLVRTSSLGLKCGCPSVRHRTARLHLSGLQQCPRPLSLPSESAKFQFSGEITQNFKQDRSCRKTGIRRTRQGGKVVGDTAGVRWGGGAPSGGKRRDVRTLNRVRTNHSQVSHPKLGFTSIPSEENFETL
ncbi:hypothetical protein ACLB2K_013235 [Fragaria x ananassa]